MGRSGGGNIQRQEQEALYTKEHDSANGDGIGVDDIMNFIGYGPLQVHIHIVNIFIKVARIAAIKFIAIVVVISLWLIIGMARLDYDW